MCASINTILIIGATSGIGEAFATRFHSMGKKVIVTGRRVARLEQIQRDLPGVAYFPWDMADLAGIPEHVNEIFTAHPDIDTVFVNGGVMYASSLKDIDSTSDANISTEITTNLAAPLVIAHHVIPRLLAMSSTKDVEVNFIINSSGLGFLPAPRSPVYGATKSGIHHYLVSLRQQLKDTRLNVVEIVPPYTATDLTLPTRTAPGAQNLPQPMTLSDFTDEIFATLNTCPMHTLKEVSAGSAKARVQAWRDGPGKLLEQSKIGG